MSLILLRELTGSFSDCRYEASDFDEFDLELAQAQRPEMEKNLQFMRKKTPIMKSSLNGVEAVRYEIDETDEDDDEC